MTTDPGGPITTTDYHTAGEPFRIVTGGAPYLTGGTVLERRRWVADHADHVRRLLVNEPRGHADMYGGFVTPPDDDGADLGVVFFHNEGYSTACGHGTIALVTWAIESGRIGVTADAREVGVTVDVPSGRLPCVATIEQGEPSGEPGSEPGGDGSTDHATAIRVSAVRFRNVPAFVLAHDVVVETSRGKLALDIAFGGAFYGSLDVRAVGLRVEPSALPALIDLQRQLRPALERAVDVVHPNVPDLRGIYGVIFWEPTDGAGDASVSQRNVTVFADGEVDRSPCGSGTSARLAILHARGEIGVGQRLGHRSIVDTAFDGRVVGLDRVAGFDAVVTEVEGRAFRTGDHTFVLDQHDPLGTGVLLR
jgi:proline racemase